MPPRRGPRCRLRNRPRMIGRSQPPGPGGPGFLPQVPLDSRPAVWGTRPATRNIRSVTCRVRREIGEPFPGGLSVIPAAAVSGEAVTPGAVSFDA